LVHSLTIVIDIQYISMWSVTYIEIHTFSEHTITPDTGFILENKFQCSRGMVKYLYMGIHLCCMWRNTFCVMFVGSLCQTDAVILLAWGYTQAENPVCALCVGWHKEARKHTHTRRRETPLLWHLWEVIYPEVDACD